MPILGFISITVVFFMSLAPGRVLGAELAAIFAIFIVTMLVVILLYDQLMFRPLVAWVDGLRFEQEASGHRPRSWALTMMHRSRLISAATAAFFAAVRWASWALPVGSSSSAAEISGRRGSDWFWFAVVLAIVSLALWHVVRVLVVEPRSPRRAPLPDGLCSR